MTTQFKNQQLTLEDKSGLSPFELQQRLIAIATRGGRIEAGRLLNAGRGNPNWIATAAREAFFLLGRFALTESQRVWNEPGLAGMPEKSGIAMRLQSFLEQAGESEGRDWVRNALTYCSRKFYFDPDALVHEIVDAIVGDNYPRPVRMLTHCELITCRFLERVLGVKDGNNGKLTLFATEGATAGIGYLFDSLLVNGLLKHGDRIALGVPAFSPYIEIPRLERYGFEVVEIQACEVAADGSHSWQYPDNELDKLNDPEVKVLFLINPSNPPSVAMRARSAQRIADIVRSRGDLIVITDDVYATFVDGFRSLLSIIPYNTVCLYSFSKIFGCTGWRLGVIALHEKNVLDDEIAKFSGRRKTACAARYSCVTADPDKLKFIDRMVADSRQVALNHTAGLSTPQQVQMALFALAHLLDDGNYVRLTRTIVRRRLKALWKGLGVMLVEDPLRAGYYAELDFMVWATRHYGSDFARFVNKHHRPYEVLQLLAAKSSIVLMPGSGFEGPEWSVRVSLANLPEAAYAEIGKSLRNIADSFVREWQASNNQESNS